MILLISDLHLQMKKPDIVDRFLEFLQEKASVADALYILGDLFDIWIGDDDINLLYHRIALSLKELVNSGVPCYFIHGNRDFLIGQKFARKSGMTILPEKKIIKPYKRKILIMHGDTLCTNDKRYQILRSRIRTPWIQKLFLSFPLFIRNYIADKVRISSKTFRQNKSNFIMNLQTVVEIIKKYQVQYLIHGHIHRPCICEFTVDNQPVSCITLGAWYQDNSVVRITPEKIELIHFLSEREVVLIKHFSTFY